MIAILVAATFLAYFLVAWFQTEFFSEWAKYLGYTLITKVDEYLEFRSTGGDLSYPEFLVEYHNNFLTRMLNCPICLSAWAAFPVSLLVAIVFQTAQILFVTFSVAYIGLVLYHFYLLIASYAK